MEIKNVEKRKDYYSAYAPDENYTGIRSLPMICVLKNTESSDEIEFVIIHSGLSDASIEKINSVKNMRHCNIRFT